MGERKDGYIEGKTEHQIAFILLTALDSLVIPSSSMTKKKLIANKLDIIISEVPNGQCCSKLFILSFLCQKI